MGQRPVNMPRCISAQKRRLVPRRSGNGVGHSRDRGKGWALQGQREGVSTLGTERSGVGTLGIHMATFSLYASDLKEWPLTRKE